MRVAIRLLLYTWRQGSLFVKMCGQKTSKQAKI